MKAPRGGEVALLAASLAVFLLGAEGVVRLLGAGTPRPTGYAPVKTGGRFRRPLNSFGYRDNEHPLAKPPGQRRLVSLGDSFAWGVGVEFEDTYSQRLERGLTRRRHEVWKVVNLALPGMNSVDEAVQLADEGMAYDPDVVLLGYVLNDSEDVNAAEARRAHDWEALREERKRRRDDAPSLLERSALYRVVRTRVWATVENRRRITGYKSMYAPRYPGWIAAQEALKKMGRLCQERHVPFVIAIFPLFGNPLDDGYPFTEIHAKVAEAATAAGAKGVDLLPAYRGLRWDVLVIDGTEDEHPNEIAHRIAADVLLKALDDVVPWTKPPERERAASR